MDGKVITEAEVKYRARCLSDLERLRDFRNEPRKEIAFAVLQESGGRRFFWTTYLHGTIRRLAEQRIAEVLNEIERELVKAVTQ